jgi:nicotinamide-nucleotide amidase
MGLYPADIESQASAIIVDYRDRGWMIATAESCSGGLIAGALTEIAGSSAVVDRGFVTYTNQAKMDLIGVSAATLDAFGAVSKETALQMAHGALMRSGAEVAVAVTGIAGPGGGSAEKPVGLVHLALKTRSGLIDHREMRYGEIGRDQVRLGTVRTALEMLVAAAQTPA